MSESERRMIFTPGSCCKSAGFPSTTTEDARSHRTTDDDDDDGGDDVRENQLSGIQVATLRESAASNNKCQCDASGREKKNGSSDSYDENALKAAAAPVPVQRRS